MTLNQHITPNVTTMFAISLSDFFAEGYAIINYSLMRQLGVEWKGYFVFINPRTRKKVYYEANKVTRPQLETAQARGWQIAYLRTEYAPSMGAQLETIIVVEKDQVRVDLVNHQMESFTEVEANRYGERLVSILCK